METQMLINMPLRAYEALRSMCASEPGYWFLNLAAIVRNNGSEDVNLLCNHDDGHSLLDLVWRNAPELCPQITLAFIPDPIACGIELSPPWRAAPLPA
jgi:hypothetical protein